jgi:hypothetical protein
MDASKTGGSGLLSVIGSQHQHGGDNKLHVRRLTRQVDRILKPIPK